MPRPLPLKPVHQLQTAPCHTCWLLRRLQLARRRSTRTSCKTGWKRAPAATSRRAAYLRLTWQHTPQHPPWERCLHLLSWRCWRPATGQWSSCVAWSMCGPSQGGALACGLHASGGASGRPVGMPGSAGLLLTSQWRACAGASARPCTTSSWAVTLPAWMTSWRPCRASCVRHASGCRSEWGASSRTQQAAAPRKQHT